MSLKKWLPLLAGMLLCLPAITDAQTLFSFGGTRVSKDEFLNAYYKNNPEGKPSRQEMEDYLELYIRYRLKVQWAYEQQLDTLPSVQMEWESFRNQVAAHYITDDSTLQALVTQAMVRSMSDRKIAHIYVARTSDSAQSFAKISAAMTALKAGKSFEEVALKFSEDPSVNQNKGTIGWISPFVLPYALENLAYETAVNTISQVYSSENAWHIFKVLDSRPAQGKTGIAQILLEVPATAEEQVKKKADSIYKAIQAGADFSQMAKQFSDDNGSYMNGGELPAFAPGTYDPSYEENISRLQTPGSISAAFRTSQGYHIVKLLSREGIPDTSRDNVREEVRNKVLSSDRNKLTNEIAYLKARKQTGLKLLPVAANRNATTVIATLGKREITEGGFQLYRQDQAGLRRENEKIPTEEQERHQYIQQQVMQEYLRNLEIYSPAFAAQLKDFREGTLIFEAMQQQVWDKAANDEKGLEDYYRQNVHRYTWKDSFRGVLFTCSDEATAQTIYQQLVQQPSNWSTIIARFRNTVIADTGRFEYDQLPFKLDPNKIAATTLTRPQAIQESEQVAFIYCIEKMAANLPRTFQDARGYVLNDYQNQVEENWIRELKKTYPVKVNKSVLNSLNR
ncbi:peptidylprolyl isomerase [Flavihumibacter sp. UBA7668]|uniref:peptidylprolyl isomerase n=1 Tax=Flavihumibacter sp. UBA7668 TaxID=1946542 RepID=UPI0025C0C5A2|nr:peptidylprolyl isomerase [Flavihumibacter sp. UBA7668]